VKLVASLIVRNELGRFLTLALPHLLTYCDEVRVLDDGSTDGSYEYACTFDKVHVLENDGPRFFEHEGQARQLLWEWTLNGDPTHVLAIDADEFISDPKSLLHVLQRPALAWTLTMEEIWKADEGHLYAREDGGWRAHPVPTLFQVPRVLDNTWVIKNAKLACGREPVAVRNMYRQARKTNVSVLHFGWANEAGRRARYERYAEHDKGNFHASSHLESIMWPDAKVRLRKRGWPLSLDREALLEKVLSPLPT